ncbi:MAG: SRPBCC family protein [Candidatus Ranarchaeia archaeon]
MPFPKQYPKTNPDDVVLCRETVINAPITVVFDVVTDLELFAEIDPPVESVTITSDIRKGKGVTSHWVAISTQSNKKIEWDEEIIYYDRPHQYAFRVTEGEEVYEGVHTLTENPDGTTHIMFCETYHFKADVDKFADVLEHLLANVKRVAEERAAK